MQRVDDGPRVDLRPKAWASMGPMVVSGRPTSPAYSLAYRGIFGDPLMDPSMAERRRTPSPMVYSPLQAFRSDRPMSSHSSLHAKLPDPTEFYTNSSRKHYIGPGDHSLVRDPPPGGYQALSTRASSPMASLSSRNLFGDPLFSDAARHGAGPGGVPPARAGRPDLKVVSPSRFHTGARHCFERDAGYLGDGLYVPGPGCYRRREGDMGTRCRKDGSGTRVPRGRSSAAHSLGSRDSWKRVPKQASRDGPARAHMQGADPFADRAKAPRFSFGRRPRHCVSDTPGPGAYG